MPRGETQSQNHPCPGAKIKVYPIRDPVAIADIKNRLRRKNLRDFCLFTLGINTAYRAGELLSLTIGQVTHLRAGDILEIKQSKTGRHRATTLNRVSVDAIQCWLARHPAAGQEQAPLFLSQRSERALGVAAVNRLVKKWCAEANLSGNFGSHTLRKTWGYHQRVRNNAAIPLLMTAYGHATQAQTLAYLDIQDSEISDLYIGLEL